VRDQLNAVDGVVSAEVDFSSKTATVTVEKGTDPVKVASGLSGQYSGTVRN
jgi:copper chaperone CopZ